MLKIDYTLTFNYDDVYNDFWEDVYDDYYDGSNCALLLVGTSESVVSYVDYVKLKRYCTKKTGWYDNDIPPVVFTRMKAEQENPQ